jgi:N-acetylglucosaminyldiphosphoundecaprenol N-acetyl-beta-D-mannosaminyltransferase
MSAKKIKKGHFAAVKILGVRVDAVSRRDVLGFAAKTIEEKAKAFIVTPNPEQVVMAQKDVSYRNILNSSSLALCDGIGLLLASRFIKGKAKLNGKTGNFLKKRVTGEETMREIIAQAKQKGWRVMLVGGKRGVAATTALIFQNLKEKDEKYNEKFTIAGINGHQDISVYTKGENDRVVKQINDYKADVLFVAYGAPWQERWLYENIDDLKINVGMVVGGALDMVADPSLRPPGFLNKLGLDWFYRLSRQPWRIFRQLALIKFMGLVIIERFKK